MVDKLDTKERLTALLVLFALIVAGYVARTVYSVSDAYDSSAQSMRVLDKNLMGFNDAIQIRIYSITHKDSAASIYDAFSSNSLQRVRWVQLVRDIESTAGISLHSFDISAKEEISTRDGKADTGQLLVAYEGLTIKAAIEHEGLLVELMQWVEVHAPSKYEVTQLSLDAESPDKKIQMVLKLRWYLLDTRSQNNA